MTKKDRQFEWTPEINQAFEELRTRFTQAPLMRYFDPALRIRVETDASQFAIAAILSQLAEDDRWHPVAFASRKLQTAERNWEVYDQELLAIVYAFKE